MIALTLISNTKPSLPLVGRVGKPQAWSGGGLRQRSMIPTPPVHCVDTLPIKGRDETFFAGSEQNSGTFAQIAE